jgi:hypothetical protein
MQQRSLPLTKENAKVTRKCEEGECTSLIGFIGKLSKELSRNDIR